MKLAYSANAYMRFSIEDAIRRIAALGYGGIELMADAPHAWPEDLTPHDVDAIRKTLDDHDLTIANINVFMMNKINDPRQPYWHPSWIEPNPEYRRVRIDHTVRSLTLARQLGASSISTEPGGPIENESDRPAAMNTFVEMLKPVLDHAAREDVRLLVEPEPGLLIENTAQFIELRERIDSPQMALNFDVGHFYCVGDPLAASIEQLAPYINHVHVEDIADTRVHQHLVPGDGAIDFREVFDSLARIRYDGWLTVELYPFVDDPDAAGRRARDTLLSIMDNR